MHPTSIRDTLCQMSDGAHMTYLQAAIDVIKRSKKPLRASEILDRMLSDGLIQPKGKTPLATLNAELYRNAGNESGLRRVSDSKAGRAPVGSVRWTVVQKTTRSK